MKRTLFYLSLIALLASCSSDDTDTTPIEPPNYYALTVGNSWVYSNYIYNWTTNTYEDSGVIDSVSIVGNEEIFGNLYYKFRTLTTGNQDHISILNANGEHFKYLRDYEGTLVSSEGNLQFSNNNYEEEILGIHDWGTCYQQLQEETEELSVNAEVFICDYAHRYCKDPNGVLFIALDKTYYSEGIGLIHNSISYTGYDIPRVKRYLVSYSIN